MSLLLNVPFVCGRPVLNLHRACLKILLNLLRSLQNQNDSWKMPKPRKSPLQEAKDLGKAKSQKSKQKKTGKGFN